MPVEVQMTFNSSMSEEDFFMWLRSRGVSVKDCKTLSGKTHQYTTINNLMLMMFISENGVTALEFVQSDAEDYDDIGLTKFGKNRVLKILTEVKTVSRSS